MALSLRFYLKYEACTSTEHWMPYNRTDLQLLPNTVYL